MDKKIFESELAEIVEISKEFDAKKVLLRLVLAWIDIHKDELLADWELAVSGEEPFRIAPLQ